METLFKNILQAGFIVSDIYAPVKYFYNNFGIGPWSIYKFNPAVIKDMVVEGKPQEYKALVAIIKLNGFGLEFIAPLDNLSIYSSFIDKNGEGFQHVAYHTEDYNKAFKFFNSFNNLTIHQSGSWFGKHISTYFNVESLKHVVEIYKPDNSFSKYKTNKYGITHRTFPVPDKIYPSHLKAVKPVFERVVSVGLIVKNLRETMRTYSEKFGISDWQDFKIYDNYTCCFARRILAARCKIGDIFIELMEPRKEDDESIYGQFLKLKGEGLHNVGYLPYDFKKALKIINNLSPESCSVSASVTNLYVENKYIYFDFSKELKHVIKLYNPDFLKNN